ncbi:MAG: potassium channel family protein [Chloroflexota bacterium]
MNGGWFVDDGEGPLALRPSERLLAALVVIVMLFTVGVLGYMLIEHFTFLDALYMTVITLTTVRICRGSTPVGQGQIFTIILLILGVGTLAYSISTLIEFVMSGGIGGHDEATHE